VDARELRILRPELRIKLRRGRHRTPPRNAGRAQSSVFAALRSVPRLCQQISHLSRTTACFFEWHRPGWLSDGFARSQHRHRAEENRQELQPCEGGV
jgi:hypothetical protein